LKEIVMCHLCDRVSAHHAVPPSRRHFFKLAAMAAASLAVATDGSAAKSPPKPENVVSPDGALDRLMKGNDRYLQGVALRHDFRHEREALTQGQNPFAGILSCADSRIAPEYAFDSGRGDLFVCRVAGNFLNEDVIASFEYAVAVLNTPLLMVLGHQACGAVDATIKSIKDGTTLPGHLPSLVAAIGPAVEPVLARGGNMLDSAIRQNVAFNVEKLKAATPIIGKAVTDGKLRIVGALYHLDTGRVELLGGDKVVWSESWRQ
jgi:carbonic anhydrase